MAAAGEGRRGPAGTRSSRLSRRQPSLVHVVVPVTVPEYGWTWTEGQALADAKERMQMMSECGRAMGLNIDVEVVSSDDPVEVVRQAVRTGSEPYDEFIVIDDLREFGDGWRTMRSTSCAGSGSAANPA